MESWKTIYPKVDGWLLEGEAQLLYDLASEPSSGNGGVILEIGSWKGKSTIILGSASKQKGLGKVYAVDPHLGTPENENKNTFPEFENNIRKAGLDDIVVSIVKTSEDAAKSWNQPIRFLWIDGNHEYDFVKLDFLLWEPFLIDGGVIAFHDTVWAEGVNRFLKEVLFCSPHFKDFKFVEGILYARKSSSISFLQKLINRISLLVWNYRNYFYRKHIRVPLGFLKKIIGQR